VGEDLSAFAAFPPPHSLKSNGPLSLGKAGPKPSVLSEKKKISFADRNVGRGRSTEVSEDRREWPRPGPFPQVQLPFIPARNFLSFIVQSVELGLQHGGQMPDIGFVKHRLPETGDLVRLQLTGENTRPSQHVIGNDARGLVLG
jgi:hypothetical protein